MNKEQIRDTLIVNTACTFGTVISPIIWKNNVITSTTIGGLTGSIFGVLIVLSIKKYTNLELKKKEIFQRVASYSISTIFIILLVTMFITTFSGDPYIDPIEAIFAGVFYGAVYCVLIFFLYENGSGLVNAFKWGLVIFLFGISLHFLELVIQQEGIALGSKEFINKLKENPVKVIGSAFLYPPLLFMSLLGMYYILELVLKIILIIFNSIYKMIKYITTSR